MTDTPLLRAPKVSKKRLAAIFGSLFLILAAALAGAVCVFEKKYNDRVPPGVTFSGINLVGLTSGEAADAIEKKLDEIAGGGFAFLCNNRSFKVPMLVGSEINPELSLRLVNFKTEEMADMASGFGRGKNFFDSFRKKITLLARPREVLPMYEINQDLLRKALKQYLSGLNEPMRETNLKISKDLTFVVSPGSPGVEIDYEALVEKIDGRLRDLDFSPIIIAPQIAEPQISVSEAAAKINEADEILALAPLTITYDGDTYKASKATLGSWLALKKIGGQAVIIFARDEVEKYFNRLAGYIERKPQEPKLSIAAGRVADFIPPRDGLEIDREANFSLFTKTFLREKKNGAELVVNKRSPITKVGDINNLGIKEIVGSASTSFADSPKNRIENIKVGVKKLSGLIIQPGEEFSVIENLKPIDAESGFLPELVIKKDKTVPEFGGGLCQIGTTMFRAAMDAGTQIIARINHSYRVPYYEPPVGMDATIYDPSPDFKFKNTFSASLLIQGYVRGTNLIFELWGAKDGRRTEIAKPEVYNIVAPPEKKIIQTEELPVGETKCTEKPHNGADVKFIYKIIMSYGTTLQREFKSHYVPWQEVCLVGVPKGTLASSTPFSASLPL